MNTVDVESKTETTAKVFIMLAVYLPPIFFLVQFLTCSVYIARATARRQVPCKQLLPWRVPTSFPMPSYSWKLLSGGFRKCSGCRLPRIILLLGRSGRTSAMQCCSWQILSCWRLVSCWSDLPCWLLLQVRLHTVFSRVQETMGFYKRPISSFKGQIGWEKLVGI
jgi:hypothetical protein